MDDSGIIRHKNGLCLGAYDGGYWNGDRLGLSSRFCNQPFEFGINGILRHKNSGNCIHPEGGEPGTGNHLVTWNVCNAGDRIRFDRNYIN